MTIKSKTNTQSSFFRLKTVESFLEHSLERSSTGWLPTKALWLAYTHYCDSMHLIHKAPSQRSFVYFLKVALKKAGIEVVFDYHAKSRVSGITLKKLI